MKKFVALALSLAIAIHASATWSPIRFEIIGERGPSGWNDSVYGLNIGLIGSRLDKMYGVSVGTLVMVANDVAGVEVGGFFCASKYAKNGILQVSPVFNEVVEEGEGIQVAACGNRTKDFSGLQIAVFNQSSGSGAGVQLGVINIAGSKEETGWENGTGIPTLCDYSGVQIGFFNSAYNFTGLQIGAINYVDGDFSGVQIGAVNIVASSDIAALLILRVAF